MAWKSAWRRKQYSYNPRRLRSYGRPRRVSFLYRLALLLFVGVLGIFLLFGIVFPIFALDLPSPDSIVRREGFSTKIYDRNGVLLYDIFTDQRRTLVQLTDVPLFLRQATIAVEDKNFYKHQGFDPTGVLRAVWNIVIHQKVQGGSTLTQQLVKNVLLSPERTLPRKIREFIISVQIERKYTKDEILQMYLNEAPYGGTAWGAESASETYFGKPVSELTLVESAILAGLPQRPTAYSPYGTNTTAYIARTEHVLDRMQEDGYISKEQKEEAKKQLVNVQFVGKGASLKAPHFITYMQGILEERYGETFAAQGGLKVTTTLDWELQKATQEIVSEEIAKVESLHITNGAAVVIDPQTGQILAMVGSKNFLAEDYDGQVNVTLSLRQPGSAIKPVTYVTALKKGYTASTLLMDVPTVFPGGIGQPDYTPANYDGKFRGPIQVRYALANSVNIPAVKVLALVGVQDMLSTAYNLGFTTLEPTKENMDRFGLSVTLGGGEVRLLDLASSYSAFANGGLKFEPVSILKVEDSTGRVLEEYKEEKGQRIISSGEAFIISNILSDNDARKDVFGTNSSLFIAGREVAAKTGTTNDKRDNWTIGWTPQVIVGVWVGNNDNSPMKQVSSGVSGAAPVWRRIILEALSGKPNAPFEVPDDVVSAEIDSVSGAKSHDGFPSRVEYFVKGTEPTGDDFVHAKLKLCRSEGKIATPSQVASGGYEEKEFFVFKEEDPLGSPNRWQEGILGWIATQGDSRYHPPTGYCGSGNPVSVQFLTPKDHEQVNSNTFDVKVNPQSTTDILEIEFYLDDVKQTTLVSAPWNFTFSNVSNGPHEIRVNAKDKDGNQADGRAKIGVNTSWDYSPTPSPSPSP